MVYHINPRPPTSNSGYGFILMPSISGGWLGLVIVGFTFNQTWQWNIWNIWNIFHFADGSSIFLGPSSWVPRPIEVSSALRPRNGKLRLSDMVLSENWGDPEIHEFIMIPQKNPMKGPSLGDMTHSWDPKFGWFATNDKGRDLRYDNFSGAKWWVSSDFAPLKGIHNVPCFNHHVCLVPPPFLLLKPSVFQQFLLVTSAFCC